MAKERRNGKKRVLPFREVTQREKVTEKRRNKNFTIRLKRKDFHRVGDTFMALIIKLTGFKGNLWRSRDLRALSRKAFKGETSAKPPAQLSPKGGFKKEANENY